MFQTYFAWPWHSACFGWFWHSHPRWPKILEKDSLGKRYNPWRYSESHSWSFLFSAWETFFPFQFSRVEHLLQSRSSEMLSETLLVVCWCFPHLPTEIPGLPCLVSNNLRIFRRSDISGHQSLSPTNECCTLTYSTIYVPGSGSPPHPPCHGHGHNINPPPPCGMGGSWEAVGVIQPTAMQLVG